MYCCQAPGRLGDSFCIFTKKIATKDLGESSDEELGNIDNIKEVDRN